MDYIAGIFELLGLYIIGNKNKFGFLVTVVGLCIWIYVSISRGVYGLLIVCIPALAINIRNFRRWVKEDGHSQGLCGRGDGG
jgi:hypothetical protein